MKTKIKSDNSCEYHLEIEIPSNIVASTFEEVYKEIKKYAKIPGFRVGNAPQDLLEKYHAKDAEEEVLKRLIPDGYRKALSDKNIEPLGMPDISEVVMNKGAALTFKARVEVKPEFKLEAYKGIKIRKKKIETKDEEIEDTIKQLQNAYAKFEPVLAERTVAKGDFAICDIEAFVGGKAITKKHEKMWVEVNKDASLLGLGEELVGMKVGEERMIVRHLPDDYPDKQYAGKDADFKVKVIELKEKKIPALDDEFAKDAGLNDLASLRSDLRKKISERKEAEAAVDMKNQILDELIKKYNIPVPPSMARRQYEILMKHLEEELRSRGMTAEAVAGKKKEYEERLKADAVNKVRIYFILSAIADKENVKIADQDVEARFAKMANAYHQDIETIRKYYENNDLIDGLLEQVREEKTLEFLVAQAEINEEK